MYEYLPSPQSEVTAEEILMRLIQDIRPTWFKLMPVTNRGVSPARVWAEERLAEIHAPEEQLILFKEVK